MANNTAALKNLAKNLKASAVKVPKSVKLCPKVSKLPRTWCGGHSELPTDTDWSKVRYGIFDAVKRDRGDNRALCAAIAQASHNRKFGIR